MCLTLEKETTHSSSPFQVLGLARPRLLGEIGAHSRSHNATHHV